MKTEVTTEKIKTNQLTMSKASGAKQVKKIYEEIFKLLRTLRRKKRPPMLGTMGRRNSIGKKGKLITASAKVSLEVPSVVLNR